MWIEGIKCFFSMFPMEEMNLQKLKRIIPMLILHAMTANGWGGGGHEKNCFNALTVLKSFTKQTIWRNTKITNMIFNAQKIKPYNVRNALKQILTKMTLQIILQPNIKMQSTLRVMCVVNCLCLTGLCKTPAASASEWFFKCYDCGISFPQKNA